MKVKKIKYVSSAAATLLSPRKSAGTVLLGRREVDMSSSSRLSEVFMNGTESMVSAPKRLGPGAPSRSTALVV